MAHPRRKSIDRRAAAIDILPDEIFREIFTLCLPNPYTVEHMMCCTNRTPFRKILSYWPAFPISIAYHLPFFFEDEDHHNVELIAALERPHRVRRITLDTVSARRLEEVAAAMQAPFPVMTHLELSIYYVMSPVLPSGFLGGSAPCLQHLRLDGIPFPELPTLLSSARGLVSLQLHSIPLTGYISPEAMVVCLAGLTSLKTLCIEISSPIAPPEQITRHSDPPVTAVLPALTQFEFQGKSKYLEDLVTQIDTPLLWDIRIRYSMEEARASQLSQFIGRTANLKLSQFNYAEVTFFNDGVKVILEEVEGEGEVTVENEHHQACLSVTVLGPGSDDHVLFMAHMFSQLGAILSKVELIIFHWMPVPFGQQDDMDRTEWLQLLRLFPAVEIMCVNEAMAGYIACALEEIAEEALAEVLPALRLLCLEDYTNDKDYEYDECYRYIKPLGSTERFLSLRKLSGHPVTLVKSRDELVERAMADEEREGKVP